MWYFIVGLIIGAIAGGALMLYAMKSTYEAARKQEGTDNNY